MKLLYIMRRANSQYVVMSKQIAFTSETLRAAQARVCSSVYISPCETCMLGLQKYPGSSGAKKLSIPNCFVSVLNVFGSPIRFQFFGFNILGLDSSVYVNPCMLVLAKRVC